MGNANGTVNLDGKQVPLAGAESPQAFLSRNGLGGRILTKLDGAKEIPVNSMADIRPGDQLGTVAESTKG